ncbi:unnamed protein product [Schistosoma turkestanicum]|nr:unnamed protein product [Schistosoma turkestanicum]
MLLGKLRPLLKSRYLIIRESSDSSSDRFTYFSSKPRFLYREYFERDEKEEKRGQLLLTVFWAWVTYFFINHPEEVATIHLILKHLLTMN